MSRRRRGRRGLLSMGAALVLLAAILRGITWALPGPDLMDFGSFFASGEAAKSGQDPYGIYPLTFHVVLPGFESWNPNLNPPISLPLFEEFTRWPPQEGFRLWWAMSALCYGATLWLLAARHGARPLLLLWSLALAGFWDTLALGQVYLPLVLAAVGAWLLLERGEGTKAGLLMGLVVAVKPNFLVWPALLFLAGHRGAAVTAGAVAAGLSVLPLFIYGPEVYGQWFRMLAQEDANRAAFVTNATLAALMQRLGWGEAGKLVSLGLLSGLAAWAWRRRPPVLEASALGLVGAILASPIAWVHYTLFLLPVFWSLGAPPLLLASAVLMVVPVPVVLDFLQAPGWVQASVGSVYGWAVVLCLLALLARGRRA